jgi:cell division protease FtsH
LKNTALKSLRIGLMLLIPIGMLIQLSFYWNINHSNSATFAQKITNTSKVHPATAATPISPSQSRFREPSIMEAKKISINQAKSLIQKKFILEISADSTGKYIILTGVGAQYYLPATKNNETYLQQAAVKFKISYLTRSMIEKNTMILYWVVALVMGYLVFLFVRYLKQEQKTSVANMGGSAGSVLEQRDADSGLHHKVTHIPSVRFHDIAGHEKLRKDMEYLVEFLKNPIRFQKMGARLPKGVILYGPPGTGKTMYAKAIAGEAGVPFFSASGSDFVEMYVGVGAKRVRELFAQAQKKTPSIVFIDEIDAVGKKRGTDNNSERDQTLNALLTQLDGFSTQSGVLVIAATNRLDMLDDALMRPGRFDRHIAVPLPDFTERKQILALHAKNKPITKSFTLDTLAKLTIGFSGAGLESLLNESAIIAATKNKHEIDNEDIDDAYYKVVMRGDKKSGSDMNQEQVKLVAWHESGHALVAKLLTKKQVPKVTIIPSTNGAGGVTFIIPDKAGLHTKQDLLHEIAIAYGGRIAEWILTGDEHQITTGAGQDIKQATELIIGMIKEYGMTEEFGMLYMSEQFKNNLAILETSKSISRQVYEQTKQLLMEKQSLLRKIAERLMEKETIEEEELDAMVQSA